MNKIVTSFMKSVATERENFYTDGVVSGNSHFITNIIADISKLKLTNQSARVPHYESVLDSFDGTPYKLLTLETSDLICLVKQMKAITKDSEQSWYKTTGKKECQLVRIKNDLSGIVATSSVLSTKVPCGVDNNVYEVEMDLDGFGSAAADMHFRSNFLELISKLAKKMKQHTVRFEFSDDVIRARFGDKWVLFMQVA